MKLGVMAMKWWFILSRFPELVLYSNQWTNETRIYKNISLILFSKGAHSLLLVWEIDGEIYTQRGTSYCPISYSGSQGVPTLAPPGRPYRQRQHNPLIGCVFPGSTLILCTLSKSDRVVITWSPSGYTPVGPDCPDELSSPCLLITTWQLVKAPGVNRNEPKIHVICYITLEPHHQMQFSVILCAWCNGYRRRKWTRRLEFKSWTRLIAFHIVLNPWERYESNYSPSSYGSIVGQTVFFSHGEVTSLGEGKLWVQNC